VLFLDEPFGALDALTRDTLQQDLAELCAAGERPVTVVMITNSVEEAILLSDRIVPIVTGPPASLGSPIVVELARPRTLAQLAHDEQATHARAHVVAALKDVNARILAGTFVAILGHSGCGKSTVLSILAGLDKATYGGVIIDGTEVTSPGPERAIVFQSPCLLPWMNVLDNVVVAATQGATPKSRKEARELARYYLDIVGIGDTAKQMPGELSLGTQQCVSLARALVVEPRFLLLDEPFSQLDSLTRFELQDLLLRVWEASGKTVIMVTHDIDEALYLADRLILMTDGPEATVGEILRVPFPRPRVRSSVLAHPDYQACRRRVIDFLDHHAQQSRASALDTVLQKVQAN